MAINFGIDENMVLDVIAGNLEQIGAEVSEKKFFEIADMIDESLNSVMEMVAYGTAESWKAEARSIGMGWGKHYAEAISVKDNGTTFTVEADGSNKFVNFTEQGIRSFSIKDGLMKSDKAKMSSEGVRYIHVPMPVKTPSKAGQGESTASRFGGREMTEEAYKIVKSGGKFSGPLKSGQEISGLSKYKSAQRHEQYGIFMTVSENSKGWQHPGVPATKVYQKVLDEVNKNIAIALDGFCKAIVREALG